MMTSCNPINLSYRFQAKSRRERPCCREAADPSVVTYRGKFWLFASKSSGYWHSTDLKHWTFVESTTLPVEDYAPDIRVIDDFLYCTASRGGDAPCPIFRTQDPLRDAWEEVSAPFVFWDPNMFQDDDGRVYLYWGCSNKEPIYGVEMDRETMTPLSEPVALFGQHHDKYGWERRGENHLGDDGSPFIEGAWMTKHNGVYYLQYAGPGTQWNVYGDGVYIAEAPLGPYTYARHNPFSYKPGGFIRGAGHGSTFADPHGNLWHSSTMQISVKHPFERRIGLFPAGFDKDGVLFCNTRFADYPMKHPQGEWDPWVDAFAGWMLLSYKKNVTASSFMPDHGAELAVNENVQDYWAADDENDAWLQLDLGDVCQVHAVQINFAEDGCEQYKRPEIPLKHQYVLEGSVDGGVWIALADKQENDEDVPHDYIELETPAAIRYARICITHMPAGGRPALSGLRLFGVAPGSVPQPVADITVARDNAADPMTAIISWSPVESAMGYNVLWGIASDKLYSCWQVYDRAGLELRALNAGQDYWVAIEAFNASGVAAISEPVPM